MRFSCAASLCVVCVCLVCFSVLAHMEGLIAVFFFFFFLLDLIRNLSSFDSILLARLLSGEKNFGLDLKKKMKEFCFAI